jgi:hypothetical protein
VRLDGCCYQMSNPDRRVLVLPLGLVPVEAWVPRDDDLPQVEGVVVGDDDVAVGDDNDDNIL